MKLTILVDDIGSWIVDWAIRLRDELIKRGNDAEYINKSRDIREGDILFILGCVNILPKSLLMLNKHNIVVHPSDLPEGRGFSPLAWQILEGRNTIIFSLFEAVSEVDAGGVYLKKELNLDGTELNEEIKQKQGAMTINMCLDFVENYSNMCADPQVGDATYYKRRTRNDSELDVDKTIREQFNLIRVVDNQRYPAFFVLNGIKYEITVNKAKL